MDGKGRAAKLEIDGRVVVGELGGGAWMVNMRDQCMNGERRPERVHARDAST